MSETKQALIRCRVCDSALINPPLYSWGSIPVPGYLELSAEAAVAAPRFELCLALCPSCGLLQEGLADSGADTVMAEKIYADYQVTYSASTHVSAYISSFLDRAIALANPTKGIDTILEIGANEGSVLDEIKRRGHRAAGFEPSSDLAQTVRDRGHLVINDYFDSQTAVTFAEEHGAAALLLSRHTLEHAPSPVDFLRGIHNVLTPRGAAFVEVPYIHLQMMNGHYPSMGFQHISYFSVATLQRAAREAGLVMCDVRFVTMDGGSMVATLQRSDASPTVAATVADALALDTRLGLDAPEGYKAFFDRVDRTRGLCREHLTALAEAGRRVIAYGAGGRGQALLNMCGLDSTIIPCVVDDTPKHQGRFVPGTGTRVVDSSSRELAEAEVILVTAPTHVQEIVTKERARLGDAVRFMASVPTYHEVPVS